jgi:hypothetical protein
MKWVKVKTPFTVAATGRAFKQGQVVEVSDELAKRHGAGGTGFLSEVAKPKTAKAPKPEVKEEPAPAADIEK